MFRAIIAAVALLMAVPAMPAPPEKPYMLITRATVIDGDTLATGDRKIRL